MRRVLVLRPEPGASATVSRARERGLESFAIPLFEVEPVEWEPPDPDGFDGLLLTSANAVRHGGEPLKKLLDLPVYAVGPATADASREAGFEVACAGESGVERLLGWIDADLRLLHLAGEERTIPAEARQEVHSVAVYRSRPIDGLDLEDVSGCIALIHSPLAGRRFAQLVRPADKESIVVAAISREAADAAGGGWAAVEAAEAPNDDALLALTERLCNKAPAT